MSSCPHSNSCEMYELFKVSGALGTWKAMYCDADFERCSRYQRAATGKTVPVNLLPTGQLLERGR